MGMERPAFILKGRSFMYLQNKIVSIVTFAFIAWLFFSGSGFPGVAAYMPVFVAMLGMLCSALLFISVCIKQGRGQEMEYAKFFPKKETVQLFYAFTLVVAYCVLLKPVGFVVTSFLFFFLFSLCFGKKEKIVQYLLASAAVVGVIYFGFGLALHTNFPKGYLI